MDETTFAGSLREPNVREYVLMDAALHFAGVQIESAKRMSHMTRLKPATRARVTRAALEQARTQIEAAIACLPEYEEDGSCNAR